jgi:hypothetical protein
VAETRWCGPALPSRIVRLTPSRTAKLQVFDAAKRGPQFLKPALRPILEIVIAAILAGRLPALQGAFAVIRMNDAVKPCQSHDPVARVGSRQFKAGHLQYLKWADFGA